MGNLYTDDSPRTDVARRAMLCCDPLVQPRHVLEDLTRASESRRERKMSMQAQISGAAFCQKCKFETPKNCLCLKEKADEARRREDREWREK